MCCEHDHQNRLSSRPPRRHQAADAGPPAGCIVIDHGRRSHRLTAQLVRSTERRMLDEEGVTG
jgi:hypothetical protein